MASFNTGATQVLKKSDRALQVAMVDAKGRTVTPWFPKQYCQFKLPDDGNQPTLFVQTWFAKKIGVA